MQTEQEFYVIRGGAVMVTHPAGMANDDRVQRRAERWCGLCLLFAFVTVFGSGMAAEYVLMRFVG